MIYFIYSKQTALIKDKINSIAKEKLSPYSIDEFNFVKFDAGITLVQDVVLECNFFSLVCPKKVVSLEKCYFLKKDKGKSKIEASQDYTKFLDYLKNPNENCDLLISVDDTDLDRKNEILSYILNDKSIEKIEISDFSENQWNIYVKQCISKANLKIDFDALSELCARTACDINLLNNTILKLSLYGDKIKYKDVALMVSKPLEENSFSLFNYIIQNRIGDALKLFKCLKENSVEPVIIISMLTNQFFLLDEVKYLIKKGKDKESIAKELAIKPGRVYILSREGSQIKQKRIHSILKKLYQLDLQIKSGQIDRYYAFELFLLKVNEL